jgi:glycerol-3-phosphate dehydrogenase (NAD(P)+)
MSQTDDRVAIIGDGQMGLVLADALASTGVAARLWGPFAEPVEDLATTRRSPRLADFTLPDAVLVTADHAEALGGATLVVNAIPTQYIDAVWQRLASQIGGGTPVVCVSKGIETETLRAPTEIIGDAVQCATGSVPPLCALSGPTIARELARRLPATMVAASRNSAPDGYVSIATTTSSGSKRLERPRT